MVRKIVVATLLMGALLAPLANAATSGTSNVTLAASANALIQIVDAAITLSPNATDYTNDYVEATGAAGIDVDVKTNSTGGLTLLVRCADASPQITLADLLVRTATAPGTGGSSMRATPRSPPPTRPCGAQAESSTPGSTWQPTCGCRT